jgi:hypothetical protein
MGGDDLGSDDEFLHASVEDSEEGLLSATIEEAGERKRKLATEDDSIVDEAPAKKSTAKLLIEAGRGLEKQSAEEQAAFLWLSLKHYSQLQGETTDGSVKITPTHFKLSKHATLFERLKEVVSLKKLKNWKPVGSPMVIVVCVSARRAVAVLKELAGLKVRAAKCFAKHMDLEKQKEMLRDSAFGIAVGTPNRLKVLCEPDNGGKSPLYLGRTGLVVLDSHVDAKGFSVCTLPDTSIDTIDFVRENVLPQVKKRNDIQLAFL